MTELQPSVNITPEDQGIRTKLGSFLLDTRKPLLFVFGIVTLWLGWQMTHLRPDASFEKMIPVSHPYIINYFDNRDDLTGLGNAVRITVETTSGEFE